MYEDYTRDALVIELRQFKQELADLRQKVHDFGLAYISDDAMAEHEAWLELSRAMGIKEE